MFRLQPRSARAIVDQAEQLSALVGDICDSALDPSLWTSVLGKAGRFVGSLCATLSSKDTVDKSDHLLQQRSRRRYVRRLRSTGASTRSGPRPAGSSPTSSSRSRPRISSRVTSSRTASSRWARPQGLVDLLTSLLDTSATSAAFRSFRHEPDGIVDDERAGACGLSCRTSPYSAGGKAGRCQATRAATSADTLDSLSAGVCLVDTEGRIVHAMPPITPFWVRAILSPVRPTASQRARGRPDLPRAVRGRRWRRTAIDLRGIALPLTARDGVHSVAHVLPLSSALTVAPASAPRPSPVVRAQGFAGGPVTAEIPARQLRSDPDRAARSTRHRRGGRRPRGRRGAGSCRQHRQDSSRRAARKTGADRRADLVRSLRVFAPLLGGREPFSPPTARLTSRSQRP